MNKKKLLFIMLLVFSLFMAACSNEGTTTNSQVTGNNEESDNPIVIQMANHHPAGHNLNEINQIFMDRAVELSEGKIKFEYYPGEQLGGMTEIAGLVKDGAIDMGYVFPPGSNFLPLNTVVTLPSLADNPIDGVEVYDRLLDGVLKEELEQNNLKKIFAFLNPPGNIMTTNTKVESVDDLKGLKFYASGGVLNHIPQFFKATAVTMPITDIYQSTSQGVIDGSIFPISGVVPYHLDEIHNYLYNGTNFGVTNQFYAINKDIWDSYPEDVQNALLQAGEEITAINAQEMVDQVQNGLDAFEKNGVEITTATPEQHEKILEIMEPLDELWVEDMVNKGVEEEKAINVLEEFRAITEEVVQNKD